MDLKEKLDQLNTAFDAFKKHNDERLAELAKGGQAQASTIEKVEKAEEHIQKLEKEIEKMSAALNRSAQGQMNDPEAGKKEAVEALKKSFDGYMRKGIEMPHEVKELLKKEMTIFSDQDGGFFVTPELSNEISTKVFESSPIRQLASVQNVSTDGLEIIYDGDEVESGWVGETAARPTTGTPQVQKIFIPVHELYANPKASQRLLDDAAVNIEAWLNGKVAEKFARDEATAFVRGNGAGKPKGILDYADGTGFNQVQRVATAANNALDGNDFIDIQAALKEPYQNNATWLMKRTFVARVRKLKDTTSGQYIWQPGLTAGQPNQLLGRPVLFADDLVDSITANTDGIAMYGDFRAGYQIVDRIGIRVLRDAYTAKPFVTFYTTKRVGGGVKLFEAIKVLKMRT
jgi:HK97 family phage major capsid protein